MKPGNVSQTVYKRSVWKQLNNGESEMLIAPHQYEKCSAIRHAEQEQVLDAEVALYGNEKDLCVFAIAQAVNHLAAKGARPQGVSIQIMLPEFAYESRLKAMVQMAEAACRKQQITLLAVHPQVMPRIETTIVTANARGVITEAERLSDADMHAGQDIVLLKWIGLEGSLRIKREGMERLTQTLPERFLEQMEQYMDTLFSVAEMRMAAAKGVSAMHQIAEGGVFAALWDLSERAGLGLQVDLRKMAVKQETIEVCECFHLNPYQLTSTGAVLLVTDNGKELADTLSTEKTSAVVIGGLTGKKEKTVINGEELRYLDRPSPDEIAGLYVK